MQEKAAARHFLSEGKTSGGWWTRGTTVIRRKCSDGREHCLRRIEAENAGDSWSGQPVTSRGCAQCGSYLLMA